MIAPLSPAVRRLVAIALLLAVLFFGWSAAIEPSLDSYREAQATIRSLRPVIERAGADTDGLAELKASVSRLKSRQNDAAGLLIGPNEAIAAAELQTRLKTLTESAKADLKSTQILAPHDDGSFRRITVRGQIFGSLAAVQRILYAVESSSPYLFLDAVEIRVTTGAARAGTAVPSLDLRLDISGYMRRPA
jgi:general secretion pathway protein M